MAQDIRKGRLKELFSRLFGSADGVEEGAIPVREDSLQGGTEEASLDSVSDHEELSPAVLSITERIAVLKKAFEFESELKDRLNEISSTRDLLLYLHDVVLFRFGKLHEIGLISPESFEVLGSLNDRLGGVLTKEYSSTQADEESGDAEELRKENEELKQRIESLHAKYMKSGIITETELSQEKEITFLQSRVREQHSQLGIARKKLKVLASYQDMVQTLRAKNSLLDSKLEHQSRLLRTLTASNPKQQELVATVENLSEENRRLRMELERQSELFEQLKMHLPDNVQQVAKDLINKNVSLHVDLEKKEAQLVSASSSEPPEKGMLDNIERLSETNIQLKGSIGAAQLIQRYIEEQKTGTGDPNKIIDSLKIENQRLEVALNAKEEQVQTLSKDPVSKQLLKAYSRLQSEYKELYMENKYRGQLYQQEVDEKKALMAQTRERTALIKENQRLRTELESSKRLAEILRKVELQVQMLKKERGELSSKYERSLIELDQLNKKLAKVTAEYGLLVKEYENIFNVK